MKLEIILREKGSAQGRYIIKAKGFIIAVLRWANAAGALLDWSPFAYVPIDPYGNGFFAFSGNRAIPGEATHVAAHCITSDFLCSEDILCEIPDLFLPERKDDDGSQVFYVLTDLHLASKPWRVRQALRAAESDIIFMTGDCVNDGTAAQFELLKECIDDVALGKVIFPVIGNHDVPYPTSPEGGEGCNSYARFQKRVLAMDKEKGYAFTMADEGLAYSVRVGDADIIGLQCVEGGRKFSFPMGRQIEWLDKHLAENNGTPWHIVLCHAPLLAHNPNRNEGMPYLDFNKRIQQIVESHGGVIFISGHTHVSPNTLEGCAEYDEKVGNIYLNGGSVVTTSLEGEGGIMAPEWNDGCITRLVVSQEGVGICISSVSSGIKFSRGYYEFKRVA